MKPKPRSVDEPRPRDDDRPSNEADRRWILQLLDGARDRQEEALPDLDGDAFVYFAHLSAIRQLTEIYYRKLLKPHQISYSEYRVLSSLRVRGQGFRTTPLDLNRFTQITSAGMTRTLDRLERAGYVDRLPNPDDRRSVLIGLTPEGWAFAETLSADLGARFAEVLDSVSGKQIKAEIDGLRVVVERLTNAVIG